MSSLPAPELSVVICTYDRPAGLAATLRSVLGQDNAGGQAREIVVIDNHPSGSGRDVVEGLAGSPVPIRYVTELTRNMSALRNRGFAEAQGRLVAMIDDDEVAAPDWLDRLVEALHAAKADIAVGPRLAAFEGGAAPAYDPKGNQFTRDLHLADHTLIALTEPSGKPRYGLGTGNSLFDTLACFPGREPPMREAFGDAGGEDAELFVRLHRRGRRIVWAARAFVTETVTANRTSVAYRLIRTRRETQHYVSIYLDGASMRPLALAVLTAKGVLQVGAGAALALFGGELWSDRRITGRLLIQHGLGKLTWTRPVGYIVEINT